MEEEDTSLEGLISHAQTLLSALQAVGADEIPPLLAVAADESASLEEAVRFAGVPADEEASFVQSLRGLSDLAARGAQLWEILGEEAAVAQVEALRSTMDETAAEQLQVLVDLVVYGVGPTQQQQDTAHDDDSAQPTAEAEAGESEKQPDVTTEPSDSEKKDGSAEGVEEAAHGEAEPILQPQSMAGSTTEDKEDANSSMSLDEPRPMGSGRSLRRGTTMSNLAAKARSIGAGVRSLARSLTGRRLMMEEEDAAVESRELRRGRSIKNLSNAARTISSSSRMVARSQSQRRWSSISRTAEEPESSDGGSSLSRTAEPAEGSEGSEVPGTPGDAPAEHEEAPHETDAPPTPRHEDEEAQRRLDWHARPTTADSGEYAASSMGEEDRLSAHGSEDQVGGRAGGSMGTRGSDRSVAGPAEDLAQRVGSAERPRTPEEAVEEILIRKHIQLMCEALVREAVREAATLITDTESHQRSRVPDRSTSAEEEAASEDVGALRRVDSDSLVRRQSVDVEITAFASVQVASSERRGVAGESSVSDLIQEVLDDFVRVDLVELVHDLARRHVARLVDPMRAVRVSMEEIENGMSLLDNAEEDDDDDGRLAEEKEERLEMLQMEHRRLLAEFRARQKAVVAARKQVASLWSHASPAEAAAAAVLQHRMRCLLVAARHRTARAKAQVAAVLLYPRMVAYFGQHRHRFRHDIAASRIQRAYKACVARRVYMDLVMESIRNEIIDYICEGLTYNVAMEERNRHREWLIAEARPAAELLQATIRRKLSPTLESIERKFTVLTTNAKLIHRALFRLVRTTRYLRGVVTTVCVEDALFGTSMDRAMERLYETAMLRLLQATFRRKSVMRAMEGVVTTASVELAVTMAFSDSIENIWEWELDSMYDGPRTKFARELMGVFHKRALNRRDFRHKHAVAICCQTMLRRLDERRRFLQQVSAVHQFRGLFACLWQTRLYEEKRRVAVKLQRRARSNALIYATRLHRRLVGRLVAIAKSNLCRRFYLHMIRVGDHLLAELSRSETYLPPPEPDTPPPEVRADEDLKSPVLRRRDNRKPKSGKPGTGKAPTRAPMARGKLSSSSTTSPSGLSSPMSSKPLRSPQSTRSVQQLSEASKESVATSRVRVRLDSVTAPSPTSMVRKSISSQASATGSTMQKHASTRNMSSVEFQLEPNAGSRRVSVESSLDLLSSQSLESISVESRSLPLPQFKIRYDMCTLAEMALRFMAHRVEETMEEDEQDSRNELVDGAPLESSPTEELASPLAGAKPLPLTDLVSMRQDGADLASDGTLVVASHSLSHQGSDPSISDARNDSEGADAADAAPQDSIAKKFVAFCSGRNPESAEEERCIGWLVGHESELAETCTDVEDGELVFAAIAHFVKHVFSLSWPVSFGEMGLEAKRVASLLELFMALRQASIERAEAIAAASAAQGEDSTMSMGRSLLRALLELSRAIVRGSADKVEAAKEAATLEKVSQEVVRSSAMEASAMVSWLTERESEVADLVKDVRYLEEPSLWVTLWLNLVDHSYATQHVDPCSLLQDQDAHSFADKCVDTMTATFPAAEKPFQLYDDLWTIVPFPDEPDKYKTYLYKPCIPRGYALNASGIRVQVDAVKEDQTSSIFEAVFALSWSFGEDVAKRIVPTVSNDLPLGLFGAMTARRRRERVRMWCDIAIERCMCALLLHLVRCTEGARMAAACWVLSVLCLLPGRAVTLHSLGAIPCIVALIAAGDHITAETAGAAGLALQVLLSDDYVASCVSADVAAVIARAAKRTEIRSLQGATVYALKRIVERNERSRDALLGLEWLPARLKTLVFDVRHGHTKAAADAALVVSGLCVSDEASDSIGAVAGMLDALAELLRSEDPLCRTAALDALLSLARTAGNGSRMMAVEGLHELLVQVFNSDSLQFFTMSADLFCLLVGNPRHCTMTLQHVSVLSKLLRTVLSTDQQTATVSMRLIEKLATSVEQSWVHARDATESNRDRMEGNIINAELSLQFGKNVHALSVICSMLSSPFAGVADMAARSVRAILRCSPEARRWLLETEWAVQLLVRGMRSESQTVQRLSLWAVYDLAVPGAQVLFKHNAYMELKVLLYTVKDPTVQVAVMHALESFVLGLDRVATPDQDMVEEITSRLLSDDEGEQEAAASVIAQMITQDYIDLTVNVHEGRYLPQSDTWGLCDPFVILKLNGQEFRSATERNTLSPKWDYKALFSVSDKSEDLIVELWDWDNAGDEFLGAITMSCEKLEELGDENRRVQMGRELGLQARKITMDAHDKANEEMEQGKQKETEILAKGKEEAEKLREAMLEEARFLASDPKAEAKRIQAEAVAEGERLVAEVAGKSRVQEYRAAMECERLKKEAKLKAAEIQKVWEQKTAGLSSDDVEDRVDAYKRLAESKAERALKTAEKEAEDALMAHVKVATKLQKQAAQESQQLLDLRQGWYVPLGTDEKPLMGKKGIISGFDESGNLKGDLEWAPASIQMSFDYTIKVNVDRVVWWQEWVLGRCHELLMMEGRESLWVNVLRILRALTEDIDESRTAIGEREGLLTVLANILETPDVFACYMEVCKLLQMLAKESSNVLAIVTEPHLMKSVKNLRKWKGTALADIASATATKIDKSAARIKKQDALSRRNQRNTAAVEKKKAAAALAAAANINPKGQASDAPISSPLAARGASPLSSPATSPLAALPRRRPPLPTSLADASQKQSGSDGASSPGPLSPLMLESMASSKFRSQPWTEVDDTDDNEEDQEEEEEEEEPDRTDPDAIPDDKEPDLTSLDLKGFLVRRRRASMVYA